MKHIKLIVTGDCEKRALSESLKRHFPVVTQQGVEVTWANQDDRSREFGA